MTRYQITADRMPESDYEAMPRQLEMQRGHYPEGDITTVYERLSDDTERVTWSRPGGSGATWLTRWACGLDNAPPIGSLYRVLRDEWERQPNDEYLRTIHSFELAPETEAAEGTPNQ